MGRDIVNKQKWERKNLKAISLKLNVKNEADVIKHLDKIPNKRAYIIELIRKDINED